MRILYDMRNQYHHLSIRCSQSQEDHLSTSLPILQISRLQILHVAFPSVDIFSYIREHHPRQSTEYARPKNLKVHAITNMPYMELTMIYESIKAYNMVIPPNQKSHLYQVPEYTISLVHRPPIIWYVSGACNFTVVCAPVP